MPSFGNGLFPMWDTNAEVIIMAKKGMPDVTCGPENAVSPVPQIQGKAKSGKEKAKPIIAGTTGANQKVWHEKPISKAHGIIDTDLARDNLENDIPFRGFAGSVIHRAGHNKSVPCSKFIPTVSQLIVN